MACGVNFDSIRTVLSVPLTPLTIFRKIRWHNEVQSNSEVYSSFASIYINPVIN